MRFVGMRNARGVRVRACPGFSRARRLRQAGLHRRDEVGCGFGLTLGIAIVASYVNEADDHGGMHEQGDARREKCEKQEGERPVDVPDVRHQPP